MRLGIWSIAVISLLASQTIAAPAAPTEKKQARPYTRNVAIVIWDGAEILDWAGPTEVFAAAANIAEADRAKAFNVYTVSKTKEPIVTQGIVHVQPDYSIADAPKPDIVVFPGGAPNAVIGDEAFFTWSKAAITDAEVAVSVCTGAFIIAKAGFLDGKQATTWYGALDEFEKEFPNVRVRRGNRFVDNGKIVTTAGVSAGIDGSLHVVARLLGSYVAGQTAEYMEYRWTPEAYLTNSYTTLNPSLDSRGRLVQQAAIFTNENNIADAIRVCEQLVAEDANDAPAWLQLGNAYREAKRYEEAVTAYTKAARGSEVRANAWYGAARGAGLLNNKEKALEFLKKSLAAGFEGKRFVSRDPALALLRDDPRLEALLSAPGAAPVQQR